MSAYYVGLTGGIGSGKSAVSSILREAGAYIIDADMVARDVVEKASQTISNEFGARFFVDGKLDRQELGRYVFSEPSRVARLNGILAPLIRAEIVARMQQVIDKKVVVVDIPLLFEGGYQSLFNEVWCVVADEETRIKRVCARDNNTKDNVLKIMSYQTTDDVRIQGSRVVLQNNASMEELRDATLKLYSELERRISALKDGF